MVDLEAIWQVIEAARKLLKEQGSPQWQNGQGPQKEEMKSSIEAGDCWVMTDREALCACGVLTEGVDPVYTAITEGTWQGTGPYLAIHRFAVAPDKRGKGVAKLFLKGLVKEGRKIGYHDLRIDTYPENHGMIRVIESCGFSYRGRVYFPVPDGERVAFQLIHPK